MIMSRTSRLSTCMRIDSVVSARDAYRWAAKDPLVRARTVAGGHEFVGDAEYPGNLRLAMGWLHHQASGMPKRTR